MAGEKQSVRQTEKSPLARRLGRPLGSKDKTEVSGRAGRPAGTKNKIQRSVKDNIISVFTKMGGTAEMAKWAKANQTEFYKIYAKLLPMQVTGENGDPIRVSIENARTSLEIKISAIADRVAEIGYIEHADL